MTDHPPVICGQRRTLDNGAHKECVRPPVHPDVDHYWVRLVTTGREAS